MEPTWAVPGLFVSSDFTLSKTISVVTGRKLNCFDDNFWNVIGFLIKQSDVDRLLVFLRVLEFRILLIMIICHCHLSFGVSSRFINCKAFSYSLFKFKNKTLYSRSLYLLPFFLIFTLESSEC